MTFMTWVFVWNENSEHRETRGCKQKHGNAGKWRTQRARYLTMNFGWVILECFCRWRCTPMLWEWFIQRMSKTYGGICSLHCRNYFSIVLKRVVFIVYQPSCTKKMVSHNVTAWKWWKLLQRWITGSTKTSGKCETAPNHRPNHVSWGSYIHNAMTILKQIPSGKLTWLWKMAIYGWFT